MPLLLFIFRNPQSWNSILHIAWIMKRFAYNKILLRYFWFLFHLEFPYFFNNYYTSLAKFNTFSRSWKWILKLNTFSILSIPRGNPAGSMARRARYSVAPLRRSSAGRMPASAGVGRRHPVTIRKASLMPGSIRRGMSTAAPERSTVLCGWMHQG